jgi:hypothetical protein
LRRNYVEENSTFHPIVAHLPIWIILKNKEALKDGRLKGGKDAEVLEAGLHAGIITDDEANALFLAWEARREAIRVDDFSSLGQ